MQTMAPDTRPESKVVKNRRENLRTWIAARFNGSQSRFIEECGERGIEVNQGELSGLLKTKSFGEKKARKLEKDCGMPTMYLDGIHTGVMSVQEPLTPPYTFPSIQHDEWTAAAISIMKSLDTIQKAQMVAKMREYKQFLGPPRDGQALQMAG